MTTFDQFLNANEERANFARRYDRMIANLTEIQDTLIDHDSIEEGLIHLELEELKKYLENKKQEVCGA